PKGSCLAVTSAVTAPDRLVPILVLQGDAVVARIAAHAATHGRSVDRDFAHRFLVCQQLQIDDRFGWHVGELLDLVLVVNEHRGSLLHSVSRSPLLPRIAEPGGRLTPDERRNLQWPFRTQSPVNSWTFGPLGRDWPRPKRRPRFLTERRFCSGTNTGSTSG